MSVVNMVVTMLNNLHENKKKLEKLQEEKQLAIDSVLTPEIREKISDIEFEFSPMDIKAVRGKLRKSQSEFALMIGVSVSTLQNWEQGYRTPTGSAKVLLKIAKQNPKAVLEAVAM